MALAVTFSFSDWLLDRSARAAFSLLVGGYVGVGEVTGKALPAKDFTVQSDGQRVPYLDITASPGASQHVDDPALAEWVVPITWLKTRSRDNAVRDSDFFANQNSAVKLTHGYTLERLTKEFEVESPAG